MMKIIFFLLHFLLCKGQSFDSFRLSDDKEISASLPSRALGSRIIGGYAANPKKYPFFAWLNIKLESFTQDTTFCGGTLIAPDVVMTAAHCLEYSSAIDVWVNSTTRKANDYEYFRKSIRTVVHPKYIGNKPGYDIALVFLDSPVKEVPLVTRSNNSSLPGNLRSLVTAIGFGQSKSSSGGFPIAPTPIAQPPVIVLASTVTKEFPTVATAATSNAQTSPLVAPSLPPQDSKLATSSLRQSNFNPYPEKLMEVTIYSVPKSSCIKQVGSWNVHESELCTSEEKKGVCYGDSGGPLFIDKGSNIVQIGISARISIPYNCVGSGLPQFFTSVAYFKTWLDEMICKYSKSKPSYCSTSKPSLGKPSFKPSTKPGAGNP
jgi:secreted trypsin-like serine protease